MMERRRRPQIAVAAAVSVLAVAPAGAEPFGEIQKAVVFSEYTPLAGDAEIMRRILTPLTAANQLEENERAGRGPPPDQAIDLSQEKFVVFVPSQKPAGGYALMVFIPPWENAEMPPRWAPILDQYGVILVSMAKSGNAADTANRRVPLAVLAAQNIIKRYPVDASRIYVAGLSGGSKVAMRVALAYPDLFRGAVLNAGSDPIGDAENAAPPRDLLYQFQTDSRLIYITGANDDPNLTADAQSQSTMSEFCMFNIATQTLNGVGHELAPPSALERALKTLSQPIRTDPGKLTACRAKMDGALDAKFQKVEALLTSGKRREASAALDGIDRYYGGLAAPRSTDLARTLSSKPNR